MSIDNNIPNGWVETTLGEAVIILDGDRGKNYPNGSDFTGLGYCLFLNTKNVPNREFSFTETMFISKEKDEKLGKGKLERKDFILTTRGTIGNYAFYSNDISYNNIRINSGMVILRTEDINKGFFKFYLAGNLFKNQVQSLQSGSAQPQLPIRDLKTFKILLPPLPEQTAIAKILTAFDDKIELLQAQNKTLETTAQTIFKEWFGKYQIGDELPDGWRVGKIGDFITETIGGDYGKETSINDFTEKTICLRGTDLPDMKMGVPEKAPVRFLKLTKIEKCKLINGDIVIEISGGTENQSTGRVAYINEYILSNSELPMTCVNFCRILRLKDVNNTYFIYSLFEYLYKRKVLFNWENGTTGIKNLNLKALLKDFDLALPISSEMIDKYNQIVKSSFIKIQENNSQIQTLKQTRDTLLPKLMSGTLRVNEFKETAV